MDLMTGRMTAYYPAGLPQPYTAHRMFHSRQKVRVSRFV